MRAKYCKCKNTYTIHNCDCDKQPYYWSQGIGSLVNQSRNQVTLFVDRVTLDSGIFESQYCLEKFVRN